MENMKTKRSLYRKAKKGYYHLCTDGWKEGKLFHTNHQFAYGMTVMGLATLLLEIKIYAFTLMPNHIHILLSGSGDQCVRLFSYLRRKLGDRLKEDGCPPLPENYGYQLIPVEDEEQMRANYLYLFRNPYEKGWTIPEGYRWGSCWLHYSMSPSVIRGARADTLTGRDLKRLTRSEQAIPGQWEFHPELGLLPISFVETALFTKLFPSVKVYATKLIKDYESFVHVASRLGEDIIWSQAELADIVSMLCTRHFQGRSVDALRADEKSRLAGWLQSDFHLSAGQIAQWVCMPEKTVRQWLASKEATSLAFRPGGRPPALPACGPAGDPGR